MFTLKNYNKFCYFTLLQRRQTSPRLLNNKDAIITCVNINIKTVRLTADRRLCCTMVRLCSEDEKIWKLCLAFISDYLTSQAALCQCGYNLNAVFYCIDLSSCPKQGHAKITLRHRQKNATARGHCTREHFFLTPKGKKKTFFFVSIMFVIQTPSEGETTEIYFVQHNVGYEP